MPPPQYSADFASTVGNAVSDTDGFEETFSVAAGHLSDAPNFLTGLDDVGTGLAGAGNPAGIPFEQEFADSLSGTIQQGQGDFDAFGVHLLGNNPPAPDPQPGGGSGGTSGGGTGTPGVIECPTTYGQSAPLLSDDTTNCDAAYSFPKVSVTGGPCTYIQRLDPGAYPPGPTVSAVSLKLGDAAMWAVAHDTITDPTNAGMVIHRVLITVTPQRTGHFLARFNVTTSRKTSGPEVWCMIVDVIATPGGGTGAGGTGGGTGSTGGTGGTGGKGSGGKLAVA